jgi:hypothetical protein
MACSLPPPLDVAPHAEKEGEKQREEETVFFVLVILKTSLSPISKSGLVSDCSLGEVVKAHLISSVCSSIFLSLCVELPYSLLS